MPGQFSPDQNPFADLMSRGQQMPQQAPQRVPQQRVQGSTQQQTAEQYPNPMQEQLLPGKTGDNAKALLSAIQGLQNYIQTSSNPQIIGMVRNLISVITRILAQEQEQFAAGLRGDGEGGQPMESGMGMSQGMGGGM